MSFYRGDYNWEEILAKFGEDPNKIEAPEELIFADYEGGGYDGQADVLFYDQGKFWYVTASHCSCYGLEDSWSPEPYSVEALRGQVERATYGFFKDHKELILDACDRLESDLGQLAAAVSRNERRVNDIKARRLELAAEEAKLMDEMSKLGQQIQADKKKMKQLLD